VLISPLAAGYVFKGIFDPSGALNGLLSAISHSPVETPWLGSISFSLFVIAVVHAWKWSGLHMLVYIAGLNAIPRDLLEAARAEGASTWDVIRRIKLPLLGPAFTFNLTLTLVGALSAFEVVFAMTRGGPARSTEVLNLLVWETYGTGFLGYATAISVILFVVICISAFPLIIYLRSREVEL
jgi:ABC-type sugar transport system permease subunit